MPLETRERMMLYLMPQSMATMCTSPLPYVFGALPRAILAASERRRFTTVPRKGGGESEYLQCRDDSRGLVACGALEAKEGGNGAGTEGADGKGADIPCGDLRDEVEHVGVAEGHVLVHDDLSFHAPCHRPRQQASATRHRGCLSCTLKSSKQSTVLCQ